MEEKRTILAFVLIGLILLLMPYYYELTGTGPESPPPVVLDDPLDAERGEEEPVAAESAAAGFVPAPDAEVGGLPREDEDAFVGVVPAPAEDSHAPRTITVTTPLQELVFSTTGGALISARMADYDRHEGEAVELIRQGAKVLTVRVLSETSGGELDLRDTEFVPAPETETIRVGEGQTKQLRLVAELGGGRRIEKRFVFDAGRYSFDLDVSCQGCTDQELVYLDWEKGIKLSERNWKVDFDAVRVMAYINESLEEYRGEDELQQWDTKGNLKWAGVRSKYFLCAIVPNSGERYWVELDAEAGFVERESGSRGAGNDGYQWPELNLSVGGRAGGEGKLSTKIYLGPLDLELLEDYGADFERSMDLGFPVVRDIARVLLFVFVAAHEYVPNYGTLIILFALVVKILVYPLTHKSYESASKMQEIQPKVAALREKYKNDSQRLSKETMSLYKEEGVNPLGGCLPLLLQMPIFIALYQVFSNTIELRQAPFVGWISDLSVPDELMVLGFSLHVLPVLMAAAMFFQSKMTMKDPKQAMLVYMMPAVMVFIMWNFSSGLVLYWTVFNVLTIGQQYLTNHLRQEPATAPVQPPPKKRSK